MRRSGLTKLRAAVLVAACFRAVMSWSAVAEEPAGAAGLWDREDGLGGVRIVTCGDSLCGDIVWLKEAIGAARIGERVLFGMRPTASNVWQGSAFNPEDGRDYTGTMTLDGDRLLTKGCAFAGLFCKTVALKRSGGREAPSIVAGRR